MTTKPTDGLPPPDAVLLPRIRQGDGEAEALLFRKYLGLVLRVIRGRGLCDADAEEVASDTLLTAIEKAREGELRGPIKAWIVRVAKNRATDRYRELQTERRHDQIVSDELASGPLNGEDHVMSNVVPYTRLRVRMALQRLKEREQERRKDAPGGTNDEDVASWIASGVSTKDMAEYLGVNENAAKQHKHRVLKRLREELKKIPESAAEEDEEKSE